MSEKIQEAKTLSEYIEWLESMDLMTFQNTFPELCKKHFNCNEIAMISFGTDIRRRIMFDLVSEYNKKLKSENNEPIDFDYAFGTK